MSKKILFYGDIAVDIIVEARQQPGTGQDAAVDEVNTLPGGSSANTAVIASHLKQDATIMGLIGDDLYRDLLLRDLSDHKVHDDLLKAVPGKNTLVIAIINKDGEKIFYSYRGVNAQVDYGEIPEKLTAGFDAVHISGYCMQDDASRMTALALINDARHSGTPLTLDPSHLFAASDYGRSSSFLSNFEVVFPNLEEAQAMTGEKEVERAATKLRQMGPKNVVIKLAQEGCFLSCQDHQIYCPAYKVDQIVNTIGTGDAFCGGFLSGYLNGLPLEQAARLGNAAAHFILGGRGGHNSMADYEQVVVLIKDRDGIDLSL